MLIHDTDITSQVPVPRTAVLYAYLVHFADKSSTGPTGFQKPCSYSFRVPLVTIVRIRFEYVLLTRIPPKTKLFVSSNLKLPYDIRSYSNRLENVEFRTLVSGVPGRSD